MLANRLALLTLLLRNGYQVPNDSILDAFNSPFMEDMRDKILKGEKIDNCKRCYEMEQAGNRSKRMNENERYAENIPGIFDGTYSGPEILELRLGNKCNLGCLTCGTDSSSFLTNEFEKNEKHQAFFESSYNKKAKKVLKADLSWHKSENFWSQLESLTPSLRRMYIAGGEPFMIPQAWDYLQYCIDQNFAPQIEIQVSSNLTVMTKKQMEILNQFKKVNLYLSVDGIGSVNDYIRYPSQWERIDKNIDKALQWAGHNINFEVHPTLSIYTIWGLEEIYHWAKSKEQEQGKKVPVKCHIILRGPSYQSLSCLPEELRSMAVEGIDELLEKFKSPYDQMNLQRVKNFLLHVKKDSGLFHEGQTYLENFDSIRGLSWKEFFPQFEGHWS